MKAFFANIWKYLAIAFAGVIAGLVWAMKHIRPVDHIQAGTYVESQDQKIGKLKQRGEGNNQQAGPVMEQKSRKERRQERKEARRARRREKEGKVFEDSKEVKDEDGNEGNG